MATILNMGGGTSSLDVNGLPYMRVADIIIGTTTTSVAFTGLDIGKDDDYLLVSDIVNGSGADSQYLLYCNGNTTATSYYKQNLGAYGTTIGSSRANHSEILNLGTAKKSAGITSIKLTNSGYFCYQHNNTHVYGGSAIELSKVYGTSTFTMTNITSLSIVASAASAISVGSRFQLYKLVAEKVADIIVATACTSVDITGLNIDKNSEYMLVSDIYNPTGSGSKYNLYTNANTTATNYYTQYLSGNATVVAGGRENNPTLCYLEASKKASPQTTLKLTNSGYCIWQTKEIRYYSENQSTNLMMVDIDGASTFTATSITALKITSSVATAIGINSRFTLYKLR